MARTETAVAARGWPRVDPRGAAAFALAFLLPSYLAFSGGGYDNVLRDEVGIAVWWILLLGALVGLLPVARWDRRCWIGLAGVAAFIGWSALGITWSQSSERSVNELARLAMYAGVLLLALATITTTNRRHALGGLAAAIALVSAVALASRLHPAWFPADVTGAYLPVARSRLSYPLNYWNGLAALLALGVPVTLAVAESARRLLWRALAAGSVPVTVAALFLTGSRGGAAALALGLVAYLALAAERLPKLATLVNVGVGSAVVVVSIAGRPAFDRGLSGALTHREAGQLIGITLLTCAGVALAQIGIALAERHGELPGWIVVSRRRALVLLGVALLAGTGAFVGLNGPARVSHQWQGFKNPLIGLPPASQDGFQRFAAASGSGRYQFWRSALDAASSQPVRGIGPGTFEFWWAARGVGFHQYVRNAHSLYLETFAELGFVGLALLVIALGLILGRGVTRVIGADPDRRLVLAAVAGGSASFCLSAGIEWVWQLPAIVAAFLVLAAIGLGPAGAARPPAARALGTPRSQRLLLIGVAVVALIAITIPLVGASDVRESQALAASGRLPAALARAQAAHDVQPYAASPPLQRALVLELERNFTAAAQAAAQATSAEPTDWRTWLVRSRLDAESGAPAAAVVDFRRARGLNPHSPIFKR